jgi:hypothetical protein
VWVFSVAVLLIKWKYYAMQPDLFKATACQPQGVKALNGTYLCIAD